MSEIEIDTRKDSIDEQPTSSVDKKLGDLLMRGWIMMAESCPIETCNCPLMKNYDGQKYCVGCEAWHFDNERSKKQRFGELVSLQGKQNIQLKNTKTTEVQKIPKKLDYNFNLSNNVVTCLQMKLAYLTSELNNVTELDETQKLLNCIKICIENINAAKAL